MNEMIENNFSYHEPTPDTIALLEAIRAEGQRFAELVDDECLPSREKSLAMTKIEEAVMWANASIERNISVKQGAD